MGTRAEREALFAELETMPDFLIDRLGAVSVEAARRGGPQGTFSPVEQCWHLAFRAARQSNLALLQTVRDADWSRRGVQEGVGVVTLADVPRLMRDHDASHRAEIIAWCLAR